MANSGNYFTIGQISHLCNLPVKTLRFYDQKGLLQPEIRDKDNNYRYYSQKQLLQILVIKQLKSLGFSLDEIRDFNLKKDLFLFQQKLEAKTNELAANIENLKVQLQATIDNYSKVIIGTSLLNTYRNHKINNDNCAYNIEVKEIPKDNYVSSRYRSNCIASRLFLERFAEIVNIKDKHHLHSTEPLFAIFHDHYLTQFSSENVDMEICLPVLEEKNVAPIISTFGGFLGATTIHVGEYSKGIYAYMALVDWIDNNDFEISGPAIEQYIVGPNHTDNEEELVTMIIFPVRGTH